MKRSAWPYSAERAATHRLDRLRFIQILCRHLAIHVPEQPEVRMTHLVNAMEPRPQLVVLDLAASPGIDLSVADMLRGL